ncbi:cation:proton antiporter [Helicobacter muridarum]|uniref:Cation:proton antiporter n=1 Tax=Helicobacter muridarum TaxID=216 RepID=A0A099TYH6_9HELI|nr:cation:proton antiporter [Helicobacter muridarum]TLE00740.1 cation:proton antiporter [Helicobacter muridarum]STQ86582.1 Na+/H+ antiporter [Helicobacter muridarum]
MHNSELVSFGIIALLIVIAPYISRLTRLPVAVIEIILGALTCHYGLFKNSDTLNTVAHVSFLYLMLLAGMEVDLRGFSRLGRSFYKKAMLYFGTLYAICAVIVIAMQLKWIYIAILPVMSLGMIVALLRDYGKTHKWLNIALRIGIIGELASIVALIMVQNGYSQNSDNSPFEIYKSFILLAIFIITFAILFRISKIIFWWKPTLKLWFMPTNDSYNQDIRFSFMLFFVLIGITTLMDIEDVLGAFLAGMVVATFFSYKYDMVHKLNDIGFGFFVPLFFVYVGSTLNLNAILHDHKIVWYGISIAFVMFLIRLIASYFAFKSYFCSLKDTTLFALSGCMPLTFLVAIAKIGLGFKAIDDSEYYSLVIAAVFEAVFFTVLIKIIFYSGNSKARKD